MSQESRIEIINRDGWRKDYPLHKGIVYIGSAPTNDIVLDSRHGGGVAPLHAQLIANHTGYKLINLADLDIGLGLEGGEVLPPRGVMDLIDGQSLRLGEFTLVFRGGGSPGGYGARTTGGSGSRSIGLSVSMPHTQLAPHQSLEGAVIVRNLGGKTGVRFDVDLQGLDEACYDIAPGPLLSSGAEKEVFFRIHHRGVKPLAGEWRLTFRATASRAYPGEQATVTQRIEVLPLYRYRLRLFPPGSVETPPAEEALLTPKAHDIPSWQTPDSSTVSPDEAAGDWWSDDTATPAQQPEVVRPQAQTPATKPMVKIDRKTGERSTPPQTPDSTPASPSQVETAISVSAAEKIEKSAAESGQSSWLSRWWGGLTESLFFSSRQPDAPAEAAEVSTPAEQGVAIDQAETVSQTTPVAAESTALPETATEQRPIAQVEPSPAEEQPRPSEPVTPTTAMDEVQPLATEQTTAPQADVAPLPEEKPDVVTEGPSREAEPESSVEALPPAADAPLPVVEEAAVAAKAAPAQMDEPIAEATEIDASTQAVVTTAGEAQGWEGDEFESEATIEETQVLKPEADVPPQEESEQAESAEDWWDFEEETLTRVKEPQVIKLKAKSPPPAKKKEVAPEAEDLWRGDS